MKKDAEDNAYLLSLECQEVSQGDRINALQYIFTQVAKVGVFFLLFIC